MSQKSIDPIKVVLMVGALAGAYYLWPKDTEQPDRPEPTTAAGRLMGDLLDNKIAGYEVALHKLEVEEIEDEATFNTMLGGLQREATEVSHRPLNQHLQDTLGGGKWTPELAADTYTDIVTDLKKVRGY